MSFIAPLFPVSINDDHKEPDESECLTCKRMNDTDESKCWWCGNDPFEFIVGKDNNKDRKWRI